VESSNSWKFPLRQQICDVSLNCVMTVQRSLMKLVKFARLVSPKTAPRKTCRSDLSKSGVAPHVPERLRATTLSKAL
jgi:hypothetical protein